MIDKKIIRKQDIFSFISRYQEKIRSFGINKIGLFGSFVRDEQTPDSDIDFLIEFEPDKETFRNMMAFKFFMEDMLKHNIEVMTHDSISPYIKPHILKEVEYAPLTP